MPNGTYPGFRPLGRFAPSQATQGKPRDPDTTQIAKGRVRGPLRLLEVFHPAQYRLRPTALPVRLTRVVDTDNSIYAFFKIMLRITTHKKTTIMMPIIAGRVVLAVPSRPNLEIICSRKFFLTFIAKYFPGRCSQCQD